MTKILAIAVVAMTLGGCTVAGAVVGAGVGVAATAVDVTTDVAGGAVRTVTGSGDEKPKD